MRQANVLIADTKKRMKDLFFDLLIMAITFYTITLIAYYFGPKQ